MSFLDKPVSDLSLAELQRMIRMEVGRQVPPMPAGVANLQDHQNPLVTPPVATQGMVLGYDASLGQWIPVTILGSTDGTPPGTPLALAIQPGIDFFAVTWTPVTNQDAVQYDVYVSTVNGFTPGAGSLAGTTSGTLMAVRNDPGTSAAFLQGITYYFVVKARDVDGSSSASTQQSSVLVQVTSGDLAAESVTASKIVAGAITADKLEAFLILASTIATASSGARVEFDSTGIRLYDSLGNITLAMSAQSGSLQLRGQVDFGRDPANPSRLTPGDYIEFYEQPVSFALPTLVQSKEAATKANVSTKTLTYDSKTTKGNYLHLKVTVWRASGTPPTITTPTGWTLIQTTLHSGNRLRMATYKIENAAARNSVTVNLGSAIATGDWLNVTGSEWVGVENAATAEDVKTTHTETGTAVLSTGTTGATAINNELILADFAWTGNVIDSGYTGTPFAYNERVDYSSSGGVLITTTFAQESSTYRNVSSTGAQVESATLDGNSSSIGHIVTLKARSSSGGPGAGDTNKLRLYSKDVAALSKLHVTDEAATESAIALGKKDEVWRLELADVTIDPANLAAATGQNHTVSIASLATGDYCFFLGHDGSTASQIFRTKGPICTVAGQITMSQFNSDTIAVDVASSTFSFLIIHRS